MMVGEFRRSFCSHADRWTVGPPRLRMGFAELAAAPEQDRLVEDLDPPSIEPQRLFGLE
jgi:hypothetical protein